MIDTPTLLAGGTNMPFLVTRVWETETPSRMYYAPRVVDRLWQERVELPVKFVYLTEPLVNAAWMRRPSARNLERREGVGCAWLDARRAIPAYPATASGVAHWADTKGLEPEDARKVRNAMKRRRRQGR